MENKTNEVVLIRTKSRAAGIIRLISKIILAVSVIAHAAILATVKGNERFYILLAITFAITCIIAWLFNAMAEPFEHLRNCSDSMINIETMLAKQMHDKGIEVREDFR